MIPPLHLITNDRILESAGFLGRACAAITAGGVGLVVHLRSRETPVRVVLKLAEELQRVCVDAGGRLCVNDRLDVALAVGTGWGHVGVASLPPSSARRLLGADAILGASVHSVAEVEDVWAHVDYVIVGHVYDTPSHARVPGRGLPLIRSVRKALWDAIPDAVPASVPDSVRARRARALVAIGGVTPARVQEVVRAGADGVAVLSGVWKSGDPAEAVTRYLQVLRETRRPVGLPFTPTDSQDV